MATTRHFSSSSATTVLASKKKAAGRTGTGGNGGDGGEKRDATVWFVCNDSLRWVEPYTKAVRRLGYAVGTMDLGAEKKAAMLRKLRRGDILVNFLNPSRSHAHDAAVLAELGKVGYVVVNGSDAALEMDGSKLRTYEEMTKYGIATPKTLPIYKVDGMSEQASRIYAHFMSSSPTGSRAGHSAGSRMGSRSGAKTKIVVKPNMGTEGRDVRVFNTVHEALQNLQRYASTSRVSADGVILLQEHVRPVTDEYVYRAEFVDGKLLYVVAIDASKSQSLCPCQLTKGANKKSPIKILLNRDLPVTQGRMSEFKGKCARLMRDNDIDACSFEFAVRGGEIYVYDLNILTTYNEHAEKEAGIVCPRGHEEFARMIVQYIQA